MRRSADFESGYNTTVEGRKERRYLGVGSKFRVTRAGGSENDFAERSRILSFAAERIERKGNPVRSVINFEAVTGAVVVSEEDVEKPSGN